MEECREEEQIGKHPCRRAGKTYGDISESGYKSQCHTASRYHLEYSGKNGKLAVAKSLYRKADNVYECKRNVEQHVKPQKLLCKVEYLGLCAVYKQL